MVFPGFIFLEFMVRDGQRPRTTSSCSDGAQVQISDESGTGLGSGSKGRTGKLETLRVCTKDGVVEILVNPWCTLLS